MPDADAPQVEPLTLTLGQRVRYAATLRRATEIESYQAPSGRWVSRRKKVWKRGGAYFGELDPGEGVVVGLRTLSDGYAYWEDEEVGYTFESTHRHRAVLIATHIRHKHVLALLEDVEPLPVTEQRDDTAELVAALEAWRAWAAKHQADLYRGDLTVPGYDALCRLMEDSDAALREAGYER